MTDEQAAYLNAAVRCAEEALLRRVAEDEARAEGAQAAEAVYERTVDRLAPTNAPAAKVDCPPPCPGLLSDHQPRPFRI